MKQFLLFSFFFFTAVISFAQLNYSVLSIPDSLKKNADAVTREEYIKFTIKDINTAKYEVHEVITVLNEAGSHLLSFAAFSYKFQWLDDAEIKVYDALGIKKATYSKKDMTSVNYGEGLVPEGKVTNITINAPSYPITVEKNYTIKYKGLFSYPGNIFHPPNSSVEKAVFEAEAPAYLSFRYKLLNCSYQPVITNNNENMLYKWEVKNLAAYKAEKHSGGSDYYVPQVMLAPNKFQLEDYEGDMTSWKNFGDWLNKLYAKTNELKEDRKQFYKELVKSAASDKEKAKILYSYLQNNMRYVSIQLGIGGWRPFPAGFVDDKKYGDCKALSNYLKAALDAVGVLSNLVFIYRDYEVNKLDEKFPVNDFNHAILCIPQPKDSLWLECTSNYLPFAELDESTLNRKALMVCSDGGVLINTPASIYKNNMVNFSTTIKVNNEGGAAVTALYKSTGEERNNLLMGFHDLKEDDKKKGFIRHTEWKQPDDFTITVSAKTEMPYIVTAKMEYENIASFKAGTKLFLEPRLYHFFDEDIPETANRQHDYFFDYPYQQTDTTVYELPAGYNIENLPKDKNMQYPFAIYTATYKWDAENHKVTCIAYVGIKERLIKAADYSKLLAFKNLIVADANEKIVVKKE
jgi:transglutaminase-like putative cysteine protease